MARQMPNRIIVLLMISSLPLTSIACCSFDPCALSAGSYGGSYYGGSSFCGGSTCGGICGNTCGYSGGLKFKNGKDCILKKVFKKKDKCKGACGSVCGGGCGTQTCNFRGLNTFDLFGIFGLFGQCGCNSCTGGLKPYTGYRNNFNCENNVCGTSCGGCGTCMTSGCSCGLCPGYSGPAMGPMPQGYPVTPGATVVPGGGTVGPTGFIPNGGDMNQITQERNQFEQISQKLLDEKQEVEEQVSQLQQSLQVAEQRINNLAMERGQLQNRYITLMKQVKDSPLGDEASRRFADLAKKYPNFEFDPTTGVSKFHSDILFNSGSASLNPQSAPLLRDFAAIMNSGDARNLNILVVGHTDDKPIIKKSTSDLHPSNWHLSTNRANAVALALTKSGLSESRMGVAGYSKYQPAASNESEQGRMLNRRVEIYVLAPNAIVAGWDNQQRL
ncbi:OmpA/MotB family protein [Calycomorphotria hydatis]|uniref:Putative lipoprotein YiaD n=1 Tax=Calycomorphotria hydatis TaxID=2528027 RepID=A0A517T4P0_9PLAN|nr:OmpA family protein [Calycomorphotria hydatis]QDT63339.1 putative lipoprotein YiaD precursor [Calycomorphotria hydatis]